MLKSNQSIVSFNYYQNNETCYLFGSYSQNGVDRMEDNSAATFYFAVLPPINVTSLFWSFDGSINEAFKRVDTTSNGSISFVSPGMYGRGSAIYFNGAKYLNMSSAYFNLSSYSFSFEMWIYPFSLNYDSGYGSGLLGQCQVLNPSACLHVEIRSLKPYFGFYGIDCTGYTILANNTWYHLAFVYDAVLQQQSVFLNGELDCNRMANALQITQTIPLSIGADFIVTGLTPRYFNGYMDQLSYVNRAKNVSEIRDDATLVVYFSFNQASLLDSGPNRMNGNAYQVIPMNDALLFNGTSSSFQIETFDSSYISQSSSSIAFWINPYSTNGSTIVHVLFNISTNISLCWSMIGFNHQNHLVSQIPYNGTLSIIGPQISTNVWTHIAQTYSFSNGLKLYINGTFINGTGPLLYLNNKQSQTTTLGSCLQNCPICGTGVVSGTPYVGLIDEFRIYSKELNSAIIQSLVRR